MFAKRTVFVVGAGCSREFGLPMGAGLRDKIFDLTENANGELSQAVLRAPVPDINVNLTGRMTAFARGLHTQASIDQYLNFHRNDDAFVAIGKCAIAATILSSERQSSLGRMSLQQGMQSIGETWLSKLFQAMNADTEKSRIQNIFRNVSFVCFNYDRCIEVGIFNAIRFLTGLPSDQVAPMMEGLRIWHPYGTVGPVIYNDVSSSGISLGFPGREPDYMEILEGSKGLRTFTEGLENEETLYEIRESLAIADQVVYLGFSFLDQNMKLLASPTHDESSKVYATCYGLSDPDIDIAHWAIATGSRFGDRAPILRKDNVKILSLTAANFMEQYANSLRR